MTKMRIMRRKWGLRGTHGTGMRRALMVMVVVMVVVMVLVTAMTV
jgi:hypothetical protein